MRRGTRRAVAVTLAVALLGGLVPAAVAAGGDCGRCGGGGGEGSETVDGGAADGAITAEVRVEGTTASGLSVSVSTPTVRVRPVCHYERGASGAEYWEYFESGMADTLETQNPSWPRKLFERPEALEEHKDDDGYWWHPTCKNSWYLELYDTEEQRQFLETRSSVFVETGSAPPVDVVVDPAELAEAAWDAVDLPLGQVRWNPSRNGDASTFVNVETWVWVEDAPTEVAVTAQVGSVWARVAAAPSELTVTGEGADGDRCAGLGAAWTPEEAGDPCRVVFTRSSAGRAVPTGSTLPASALTAELEWTASWTSSADPTPTPLTEQTLSQTVHVPVAEIQTLVSLG